MRICGIDIGTTNTKAVVLDDSGRLIARETFPLGPAARVDRPAAEVWRRQFEAPIRHFHDRGLLAGHKVVCGISTQGGSFVPLDGRFAPLDRGFSWTALADEQIVAELSERFGKVAFYRTTGWEPMPWLMIAKVRQWVREKPEDVRRLRCVAAVPELITASLAGRPVGDTTNAQICGMFDFHKGDWADALVGWAGLERSHLAEVRPSIEVMLEDVTVAGVKLTLAGSCHDQYASMIACGLEEAGTVNVVGGTAWVVNGESAEPIYDDARFTMHPGRSVRPGRFGYIASLGAVGRGYERLLERLGLTGEQVERMAWADFWPPEGPIRADLLAGIVDGRGPSAALRFMEVAAAQVRDRLETITAATPVRRIVMTGGAAGGRHCPGILASMCGLEVEAVQFPELAAFGAALVAGWAVSGQAPQRCWPAEAAVQVHRPDDRRRAQYDDWYRYYHVTGNVDREGRT